MKRSVLIATSLLVAACAHRASAQSSTTARNRTHIVPVADYHQHMMGPIAIKMQAQFASLPAIALPQELKLVLAAHERLSANPVAADVVALYRPDAAILDISDDPYVRWQRGSDAVQRVLELLAEGDRLIPHTYSIDGAAAFIAGVVRSASGNDDKAYFSIGLKKSPAGAWQIQTEQIAFQPPLPFAQPIDAKKIIAVLDDGGIDRAVVMSAAFWIARGSRFPSIAAEYESVRAENDWVIAEAARYPQRLVPFCGVSPIKDYAVEEIVRCAGIPSVKGMKLHFANSRVQLKNPDHVARLQRFFRMANEQRMAIVVHPWTSRTYGRYDAEIFVKQILPHAPDVVVQMAHLAGGGSDPQEDALKVYADAFIARDPAMKNVYFDLTTVVTEDTSEEMLEHIAMRLRQFGLERILFGADTPIIDRPPPVQAWATFRRRIPLTDAEVAAIADNVAPYMR